MCSTISIWQMLAILEKIQKVDQMPKAPTNTRVNKLVTAKRFRMFFILADYAAAKQVFAFIEDSRLARSNSPLGTNEP